MNDDFRELAEKTVIELFDMVKDKVAEIHNLKAQLNNMEQCYIAIKKINDEQSEIIRGHVAERNKLQERVDVVLGVVDTTSYTEMGRRLPDFIDQIKETLRGDNQ